MCGTRYDDGFWKASPGLHYLDTKANVPEGEHKDFSGYLEAFEGPGDDA